MLRLSDDALIEALLVVEGGFVNDHVDLGGATNFGITQVTLGEFRHLGRPATAEEVKNMPVEEAKMIYGQKYIEGPGFDSIAWDKLRALVVDMFVNHGPRGATLLFQKALGLPGDGILGPRTLAAISTPASQSTEKSQSVFDAILAERIRFYGRIITHDPTQSKFAAGWLDRAADFLSPN